MRPVNEVKVRLSHDKFRNLNMNNIQFSPMSFITLRGIFLILLIVVTSLATRPWLTTHAAATTTLPIVGCNRAYLPTILNIASNSVASDEIISPTTSSTPPSVLASPTLTAMATPISL